MTKTNKNTFKKNIKNNKYKNKTRKNYKDSSFKKREFIKAILKEWMKQTDGYYQKDTMTIYKNDYYLSFNKRGDFYNHIHLILNNDKNINNNFLYVLKKMDKNNKIIHSPEIKINVMSEPKIVVSNMIKKYKNFSKL